MTLTQRKEMPDMEARLATVSYALPRSVVYATLWAAFTATGQLQHHQASADMDYLALNVDDTALVLVLSSQNAVYTVVDAHPQQSAVRVAPGPLTARLAAQQEAQFAAQILTRCTAILDAVTTQAAPDGTPTLHAHAVGDGASSKRTSSTRP